MLNSKTRIDIAREAYLKKDKNLAQTAHQKHLIASSINHKEGHKVTFSLPQVILGGQDGLVNVLGVILGVAAATANARLVVIAGMAATFAESVSMGAVAYTSKLAEADYYQSEYEREKWEIDNMPEGEKEEVRNLYRKFGFSGKLLDEIVEKIVSDKEIWLEVMMNQELKLEPVERKEALREGIIVGLSALVGSFIPLTAFFFLPVKTAVIVSFVISAVTLFIVGYYKAKVTLGRNLLRQGIEMLTIGIMSALVGYFVGSLFKII